MPAWGRGGIRKRGVAAVLALTLGLVPGAVAARDGGPEGAALLGEPGVAQVAPEAMVERILTALMFDPDWRLALALFDGFQRAMAATDAADAAEHSRALASDLLLFLPVDQGRRAAPGLLLALAPEGDERRLAAAGDLAALIGEDVDDLLRRAHVREVERAALLPLSAGGGLDMPIAGPVDPPPALSVDTVSIIGGVNADDVSALIDGDRQWGLLLYRLLTTMPALQNESDYARWYAQWRKLASDGLGTSIPFPPLHGGPTASPR